MKFPTARGDGSQLVNSSCGHASTTNFLDLLLSRLAEKLGLDNDRLSWEATFPEHLEESRFGNINHGNSTLRSNLFLGILLTNRSWHEGPDAVEVDGGTVVHVLSLVEVAHTNLSEISRVVFVH